MFLEMLSEIIYWHLKFNCFLKLFLPFYIDMVMLQVHVRVQHLILANKCKVVIEISGYNAIYVTGSDPGAVSSNTFFLFLLVDVLVMHRCANLQLT